MADITIVNGVYKPTYNWGESYCCIPWYGIWFFQWKLSTNHICQKLVDPHMFDVLRNQMHNTNNGQNTTLNSQGCIPWHPRNSHLQETIVKHNSIRGIISQIQEIWEVLGSTQLYSHYIPDTGKLTRKHRKHGLYSHWYPRYSETR